MLSTEQQFVSPTRELGLIATKCHVPQSEVTRLYEEVLADLSGAARVTRFLPIFAMRQVEETLLRAQANRRQA